MISLVAVERRQATKGASGAALAIVVVLAACAVLAPQASAVLRKLPGGRTVSYLALPSKARGLAAAGTPSPLAARAAPARSDQLFSNLDYNGGPVMSSNTDYVLYWSPSGPGAYPAGYQSGIAQYWTDLAHDSGGHQNADSVATQYNDSAGDFGNYKVSYGGALQDADPYPASDCGAGATATPSQPCLTDGQLQSELESYIGSRHLPADLAHAYFVVLPPGVVTCFDSDPNDGCDVNASPQYQSYCAYHGNTPPAGPSVILYAVDPFANGTVCESGQWNNGPSDGVLDAGMSHEHLEIVTDPIPNLAWTDFTTGADTGYEMGDKCSSSYGTPLGGSGTPSDPYYNQIINGHRYFYQEEWSNQGHQCLQRFTLSGAEPSATFTSTPSGFQTMTFDASASTAPGGVRVYHWQFEDTVGGFSEAETSTPSIVHTFDSSGKHTVSLTVYAPDGTSIGTTRVVETGETGPTPQFTQSATFAAPGTAVSFVDHSTGTSAPIASRSWNFGDGSAPVGGASPSHAYAGDGTYVVTLTVTDTLGQSAAITHTVTIDEPPVAAFAATPSAALPGQAITFNGAASNDPDGTITAYSWSFGDGGSASGPVVSHVFSGPGAYKVRLTVADSSGQSATIVETVPVGHPPIARIGVRTAHPASGAAVRFSGSGSRDPYGSISHYLWSFGDGSTASGSSPSHSYRSPGTYTVTLTVVASDGLSATSRAVVKVVKGARIARLSLVNGNTLLVRVTGAGRVSYGGQHVRLRRAGTAKFRLSLTTAQSDAVRQGRRVKLRMRVTFAPVAGAVAHKTLSVTV